jgi:beta-fructofuranosidase
MLQYPGKRIGDIWFYPEGETLHSFFLFCDESIPAHTLWDIGHATSLDGLHWEIQDTALNMGAKGEWDEVLATGSILKRDGQYWMAFTGHTTQEVGLAVSDDLFKWKKYSKSPLPGLNPNKYEAISCGTRPRKHWRDPFLFTFKDDVYYAVCASGKSGPPDGRGTVGLAKSKDMKHWEVIDPPEVDPLFQEMECPQIFEQYGKWYLVFSTGPDWVSSEYKKKHGQHIKGFAPYSMVSESPFGPYQLHGNGKILPDNFPTRLWAPQVTRFKGKSMLFGTVVIENATGISDPYEVEFTDSGVKFF